MKNNDHKPNRRQRRAMQRVGNKIAKKIVSTNSIKKVKPNEEENTELPPQETTP